MSETPERDAHSGMETTGHEWDGIKELDSPLPRWWLWTFYVCVIWALGYWIAMPAWPLVSSFTSGVLGYTERARVADDIAAAKAAQSGYRDRIANTDLQAIRDDADLMAFAVAGGRSAYAVNCSQCHGTGAAGSPGYPNLNDDDWLWGGTLEAIHATIRYGIRSEHEETRSNDMPAFLKDELLNRDEVNDVTEYVLSLSKRNTDVPAAVRGKTLYDENCVSCHKPGGAGDQELGAPNLANAIWLYGGEASQIKQTVSYSRRGVMPAWEGRLDPNTLKQLAVYVHALGGGD